MILALGIDAANPELVRRWADDGTLPNIAALIDGGLSAGARSVDPLYVGSTWPSICTGVNPARHGLHYLRQLDPGTYDFYRPAERELVRHPPLWRPLGAAGRRVAVLDVPLTQLEPAINGIQVVEWGAHDAVYGLCTNPPELAEQLITRYGHHPGPTPCDRIERSIDGFERFIGSLEAGVAAKARLTHDVIEREAWDLVVQVFTESHCVGHQCWHLHDPDHPAHDVGARSIVGDPLRRTYVAIDRAIGELVHGSRPAATVLLIGHGMAHWFGASFLLGEVLVRLGLAAPKPPTPESSSARLARYAWRQLPDRVRAGLGPLRDRLRAPESTTPGFGVDPATSRVLPQPVGLAVGGLRLNVVGREPGGLVAPGPGVDALADEVSEALLALVDERTGRPAVRRVRRTRSLFDGPYIDELPDLLVEWDSAVATGSSALAQGRGARVCLTSAGTGPIEGVNDYGRSGEHRPEGLFVVAGSGLGRGRLDRTVSVLDFAPSIARLVGVELADVEGRPIPEIWHSPPTGSAELPAGRRGV